MSSDGSNPLKKITKRDDGRAPVDRIEQIWEGARDAQDLIRDKKRREQRSLQEYTGEDEDTKRADVHVHVHQHSQPDIEVEASVEVGPVKFKGLPKGIVVCIALFVAGVAVFIAHLFAH